MVGKHIFISGKVQGVGFRFHAHEKAGSLKIRGWVRNLSDGRVELVAFGEPDNLDLFLDWLKTGPSAAKVENLEEHSCTQEYSGEDFYIRRDGGPTWPKK